jgi:hypothetical protein
LRSAIGTVVPLAFARGFRLGARRRLALGAGELPVRATLLVDLEVDHRLDQHEPVDLDGAGEQRPELELDLQLLQARHLRLGGARQVGQAHVLGLQRQAREDREIDRPPDLEIAAGSLLDLRLDPALVGLDRDDERQDQDDGDQHHQNAGDDQEQLFHGDPPQPWRALLRRPAPGPPQRAWQRR